MSTRLLAASAALAIALCAGASAQASVVVFDDFESYVNSPANGPAYGTSELNFAAFDHLTVQSGTVDLIGADDPWNLMTAYGSAFVDLDGSTGQGGILRTAQFSFNAGDIVTLEFDLSGNQRGGADEWSYGLETTGPTQFLNVSVLNSPTLGLRNLGNLGPGTALASGSESLAYNDPWRHYAISFQAGNAGALSAFVGTSSHDNIGPLIDNFSLSIGAAAVPEPGAWAMMLMGFAGIGSLLRARRRGPVLAQARA